MIDFEYAAPNPRAYDLANHFCEWMYNYHSSTPFVANTEDYPSEVERSRFLEAYVAHGPGTPEEKAENVRRLAREIPEWRVVNHAFWCTWGVVMSEDDPELVVNGEAMEHLDLNGAIEREVIKEERPFSEVEGDQGATASDFDYIAYADQKMRLFWGELASGRHFDDYLDVLGMEECKIIQE